LRRVQQINAQECDRDPRYSRPGDVGTEDNDDIDKAKPEVVIQVAVMQARRDRLQDMGIQPGTSAALAFTPPTPSFFDDCGYGDHPG